MDRRERRGMENGTTEFETATQFAVDERVHDDNNNDEQPMSDDNDGDNWRWSTAHSPSHVATCSRACERHNSRYSKSIVSSSRQTHATLAR